MRAVITLFTLLIAVPCSAETPITVSPEFKGGTARTNLSGAACIDGRCLIVNDETNRGQWFTIDGDRLTPETRLTLLAEKQEIDAEAVAAEDGIFYVTGSHGLSRKAAKFRPTQFLVFRIDGARVDVSTRLRDIIRGAGAIARYAERPLSANGANIEGLAVVEDRAFFGFRGPSEAGTGFVVEVGASALFTDAALAPVLHRLRLGERIGIRDMARIEDGILLLTGPVNTLPRRYQVALWHPGCGVSAILGSVAPTGSGKPEAILVTGETATTVDLIVFEDGPENGAPRRLSLPKPTDFFP